MNSNGLVVVSPSTTVSRRRAWADLTGLIASVGCAIHCAAMPLVIGYLPMLGLDWLATQGFHQVVAVTCAVIAIAAFLPGWRKHKQLLPAALGLIGIALITSHAFGAENCCGPGAASDQETCQEACQLCFDSAVTSDVAVETETGHSNPDGMVAALGGESSITNRFARWVTPLGGLFLIGAHLANHRLSCRCCLGEQLCGEEGGE